MSKPTRTPPVSLRLKALTREILARIAEETGETRTTIVDRLAREEAERKKMFSKVSLKVKDFRPYHESPIQPIL